MADHMGGVEMMGGRATELVRAVQAPSAPLTADGDHMDHGKQQMDRPMKGVVPDTMPHAGAKPGARERPRTPAPRDSVPHRH
jgi:hypothetical protein